MSQTKRGLAGCCAATVFVGAFLLFQVQPVISKMILPWFGGSPAVWTTCMLFFQVFLLAGYLYAHLLCRLANIRAQAVVHLTLLAVSLLALPMAPDPSWKPAGGTEPQMRILLLLAATVGLPYFLLAASAPLMQAWYSRASQGRSPYRFYALSNLGSLGALLSYPFLVEPRFDTPAQGALWSFTFAAYVVLSGGMAWIVSRGNSPALERPALERPALERPALEPPVLEPPVLEPATPPAGAAPRVRSASARLAYLLWFALPAFGSMGLLAVTNQICQDVAVVPFFWVVPLSIYLVTFIICFDRESWYLRRTISVAAVLVLVTIAVILLRDELQPYVDRFLDGHERLRQWLVKKEIGTEIPDFLDSLRLEVACYLAALFLVCMVCHGELVRVKPGPRHATAFYLMIAAGGAAGGFFVAFLCPLLFSSLVESHIFLIGGFLLAMLVQCHVWWRRERVLEEWWRSVLWLSWVSVETLLIHLVGRWGRPRAVASRELLSRCGWRVWRSRSWWTWWMPLSIVPVLAAASLVMVLPKFAGRDGPIVARRDFYGILSVYEEDAGDDLHRRSLYNGRILHGVQFVTAERRREPTTYYVADSGIGLTLTNLRGIDPLRVATVGLGTGTIACFGQRGDFYCFYEINPRVEDICREYFTFLQDCPAAVSVELGDARLTMERQPPQNYDVIALDAFSGDAIPAHLLTVEAFDVYLRHLKPDGVIAVHVSNRHLDLCPIVALLARHYGMLVTAINAEDGGGVADSSSEWLLVTRNSRFLDLDEIQAVSESVEMPGAEIRVWTDQFSNLYQILTQ
ncbi:MAG: hypothetical protein FJ276_07515 [Planctomycetes bacterium]|nr:hypothetical protein [Planctomycetota bacterium]